MMQLQQSVPQSLMEGWKSVARVISEESGEGSVCGVLCRQSILLLRVGQVDHTLQPASDAGW